jgi:hypothetical protein
MLNWDRQCRNTWASLSVRMIDSGMEYQRSVTCFGIWARLSWLYTVLGWVVSIGRSSYGYIQIAFWQPSSPHRYSRALVLSFHCHTVTLAGDMAFVGYATASSCPSWIGTSVPNKMYLAWVVMTLPLGLSSAHRCMIEASKPGDVSVGFRLPWATAILLYLSRVVTDNRGAQEES